MHVYLRRSKLVSFGRGVDVITGVVVDDDENVDEVAYDCKSAAAADDVDAVDVDAPSAV